MMSSSRETTPETEYNERSFENPNYRKLYAALNMTSMMGQNNEDINESNNELIDQQKSESSEELPNGWERHEDESGPYFWHIPSGTIQRDKPFCGHNIDHNKRDSLIYLDTNDSYDHNIDYKSSEKSIDNNSEENNSLTFLVHSLGWMEVEENQLTSATSSKVIQKCILDLSTKGDNNAVRCWGRTQTQQLILKIENSCLKLYDLSSNTLLNCQSIRGIHVWGVNDNNDFAFVARDSHNSNIISPQTSPVSPTSPTFNGLKCHVFHCEDDNKSAQRIATYLRDEMIRLKMNNELSHSPSIPLSHNERPKHLFIYDSNSPSTIATPTAIEFPTPIEEPRKTIAAKYLGKTKVSKPMGIEVLNEALHIILYNQSEVESPQFESSIYRKNIPVLVHISPSNILIEDKETAECIAECRVRYLSFLGISSNNVKHCGFIMQIDEKQFEAHCFECDPSSGALCKTIEAACKLRYQKCLDSHRQRYANDSNNSQHSSSIKSTIINVFSKILK